MKPLISLIALTILLTSCGAQGTSSAAVSGETSAPSSAAAVGDLSAAADALMKADSALNKAVSINDEMFQANCEKLYGVNADTLADALILYNAEGGKANEVSILRMKMPAQTADTVEKALKARAEQRYRDFDGYAPDELPKLEDARIFAVGSYWALIISDNADTLEASVRDLLSRLMENF